MTIIHTNKWKGEMEKYVGDKKIKRFSEALSNYLIITVFWFMDFHFSQGEREIMK